MTSGADLFVVCKQCGSEVSPYITECPYCGNRLRRRAPKLPRVNAPARAPRAGGRFGALLGRPGAEKPSARPRRERPSRQEGRWAASRPYATIGLVVASAAVWIAWHAEPEIYLHMAVFGPLHSEWWRLIAAPFAYVKGIYAFLAIVTIAVFGWLFERRHGPLVALLLALGAGISGTLAASAAYTFPWAAGGNGMALGLLAAWAAPDLRAARRGAYYEGDLLGAGATAVLLLAIPFAISPPEASWLAGVVGGLVGLVVGMGLARSTGEDD